MRMTSVRLSTVCFHVTDLERSIRFYADVVGLVETSRWAPEGMVEVALKPERAPDQPGLMLMWRHGNPHTTPSGGLAQGELDSAAERNAAGLPPTGYSRLILIVDDIDGVSEQIRRAGGKAGRAQLSDELGARIAFAKDPDGYMLELIEGGLAGL